MTVALWIGPLDDEQTPSPSDGEVITFARSIDVSVDSLTSTLS